MPQTVSHPTIAIDIDDVLADSTESLRMLVNERIGANLTTKDYRVPGEYWGYYERVWQQHGIAERLNFKELNAEMTIDQSHVPLMPGATFAINELRKKYQVIALTARDVSWERATRAWFQEHLGDTELYFIGNRHAVDSKTKGQLCRSLDVSILIDDNPGHCQSALDEGIEAILFGEYGWHTGLPEEIVRCKDWSAVMEYLSDRT